MPYIGNPIYQSAFVVDQFSGDGTTVAFTMSVAPAGVTNVLVAVSGVLQDPSTYGVVGNTITFSAAPPSGTGNISCRYLGVPASGVTTTAYRTVTEFTATASQTTFTPPSYNVGFINVYLNGVLLGSADYTATNGTTVVLATGASAGNLLTVESFQISSVANAIPNAAGAVSSSNIVDGAVTPAKLSTGGPYWNTSSNVGIGTTSPLARLHIEGNSSGAVQAFIENANGSTNSSAELVFGTWSGAIPTGTGNPGPSAKISAINTNSGDARTDLSFSTYNGGTSAERMRIDSSGRVTTPYQPTFHAICNQSATTSGSTLLFQTALVNIGSCYNTSTSTFTAPVAGTYYLYGSVMANNGTGRLYWRMNKNGSFAQYMQAGGDSTNYGEWFGCMTITLAAGDYINCFLTGGTPYPTNAQEQYFGGYLIG